MSTDFLPSRESELVTWSTNFSTKVNADPTEYGLTAPQGTAYAALHADYVAAYNVANDPSTRSPTAIVTKNMAKDALKENARELARIVQATPTVTAEQISELGLTVRDTSPSPTNAPTDAPGAEVVSAVVRTVTVRLHDIANPTRRGKPEGVAGASVFSYVGTTPPAQIAAWKFEGNTTRTVVTVNFDSDVPSGATVWICAFWFSPRLQSGPACAPISTNLPGGAVMAA